LTTRTSPRSVQPDPSRLRLVILMSLSSPWSREVVRHLSGLGVELHLIEFQLRGNTPGYIEYGRRDRASESEWLHSQAASVHRVEIPASFPRRFVSSVRALRRIARESDANLVLTLYGGSLAATAYLSSIRPYVVYIVGSDVLLATSLQKVIARRALSAAAAVLANGEHLARSVNELARCFASLPRSRRCSLFAGASRREESVVRLYARLSGCL